MGRIVLNPERDLLAAVLLQAITEARGTDPIKAGKARDWLVGTGVELAEHLNIDRSAFSDWLANLPPLKAIQLSLR